MVTICCPNCGRFTRIEDSLLGRKGRCKKCSHIYRAMAAPSSATNQFADPMASSKPSLEGTDPTAVLEAAGPLAACDSENLRHSMDSPPSIVDEPALLADAADLNPPLDENLASLMEELPLTPDDPATLGAPATVHDEIPFTLHDDEWSLSPQSAEPLEAAEAMPDETKLVPDETDVTLEGAIHASGESMPSLRAPATVHEEFTLPDVDLTPNLEPTDVFPSDIPMEAEEILLVPEDSAFVDAELQVPSLVPDEPTPTTEEPFAVHEEFSLQDVETPEARQDEWTLKPDPVEAIHEEVVLTPDEFLLKPDDAEEVEETALLTPLESLPTGSPSADEISFHSHADEPAPAPGSIDDLADIGLAPDEVFLPSDNEPELTPDESLLALEPAIPTAPLSAADETLALAPEPLLLADEGDIPPLNASPNVSAESQAIVPLSLEASADDDFDLELLLDEEEPTAPAAPPPIRLYEPDSPVDESVFELDETSPSSVPANSDLENPEVLMEPTAATGEESSRNESAIAPTESDDDDILSWLGDVQENSTPSESAAVDWSSDSPDEGATTLDDSEGFSEEWLK